MIAELFVHSQRNFSRLRKRINWRSMIHFLQKYTYRNGKLPNERYDVKAKCRKLLYYIFYPNAEDTACNNMLSSE